MTPGPVFNTRPELTCVRNIINKTKILRKEKFETERNIPSYVNKRILDCSLYSLSLKIPYFTKRQTYYFEVVPVALVIMSDMSEGC